MKVYIVVVNHHPGLSPNNYTTSCKVFTNKTDAINYKAEKVNECPIGWMNDYNHVEFFEEEI